VNRIETLIGYRRHDPHVKSIQSGCEKILLIVDTRVLADVKEYATFGTVFNESVLLRAVGSQSDTIVKIRNDVSASIRLVEVDREFGSAEQAIS